MPVEMSFVSKADVKAISRHVLQERKEAEESYPVQEHKRPADPIRDMEDRLYSGYFPDKKRNKG